MSRFGTILGPDGEPILRDLPIRFLTALPASGEFVGDLVSLTSGSVGLYSWNGASWVGPFGTGGGGGGAPTTAQYLVGALDAGLSAERLVTDTAEVLWDLATPGQAKASVGVIAQSKVTNLIADLALKLDTSALISALTAAWSGTSFPGGAVNGQPFFRTDHRTLYLFDSGVSRWLSVSVYSHEWGCSTSVASNTYFYFLQGSTGATRYSASVGHRFGFPVQVIGLTGRFSTLVGSGSTVTLQVTSNGGNVSGATLSFTGQSSKERDDILAGGVIAAGTTIGLKNTGAGATGTATGNGIMRFRRSEV